MKFHVVGVCVFVVSAGVCLSAGNKDYPVTPVPFTSVNVQDEFWYPRMETNRVVTVKADFKKCEETGRIDNFAKAGGLMKGEFRGIPFDDSDVYKVIEGACYTMAMHPDRALDKYLDGVIAKIASAQEPDGYLYTARKLIPPEKMPGMSGKERWANEKDSHELYNVGHMYEAAVAHYQATGKKTFLDIARKSADLICKEFGPGKWQNPPGHEGIEIGLCKLYRATGEKKYLDLAKFLIDVRGRPETHKLYGAHYQDHKPVIEQDEALGHAVRAGYLYSGMADVAALTGDKAYLKAIDKIWENVVFKRLYLTGGIGATHGGEAFGANYELPNKTAYNETCAAIANGLWNHRMFLIHGDAMYLDILERVIYNGFLSGVELTGDKFFYPNPLASDKGYQRKPWFGCACCPVNIVRFIPSIAGYVYAVKDDDIFVNLFIGGTGEVKLGKKVIKITQQTKYPWDGQIRMTIDPSKSAKFGLNVRIPGWAQGKPVPGDLYKYMEEKPEDGNLKPEIRINGKAEVLKLKNGFACIAREWKSGDVVELSLPMAIRRVVANEAVKDDAGLVALERGPIVYCLEGVDNKNVFSIVLPDDAKLKAEHRDDLLGGVTVIKGDVQVSAKDDSGKTVETPSSMLAIPYYAWCNRGPSEMNVWMARSKDKALPVLDANLAKEWSAPYRNWHYYPDHVIKSDPGIPGHLEFKNTDVPCVFQIPGDSKWYMSFIAFNGKGYNSFVAESDDLVNWKNYRLAMGFGKEGQFDYGGCVIGAYLYQSYDINSPRLLKKRDGKFWTLYGCYPKQGGYEIDPGYEGIASSDDGLTWKRAQDKYILSVHEPEVGNWEKDCIYQPWLVEHEGKFYNFYNAKRMPDWIEQMGLATSWNLMNWERHKENPIVRVKSGGFNEKFCSDGKVFRDGDHWVMFFFGVGKGGAHIMAAYSRDLASWIVDPEPLYKAGGHPGGLDKQYAHKISLAYNPKNETYYMYYCACGNKGRGIGLITSKPLGVSK